MILFSLPLKAQEATSLPNPEAFFLAIIVSDMEKSLDWYETILGFEVLNKVKVEERGFAQANLQRGSLLLELIYLDSAVSIKEIPTDKTSKNRVQGFF